MLAQGYFLVLLNLDEDKEPCNCDDNPPCCHSDKACDCDNCGTAECTCDKEQ